MFHPEHAALSCDECRKWIYDIKTAKPVLRGEQKQPRKPGAPTPCNACPKIGKHEREKSPRVGKTATLTKANRQTWRLFLRAKAGGLTDEERRDPLVQQSMALVQQIYDQWQVSQMLLGQQTAAIRAMDTRSTE